jgi:uncharacterized membrane protein YkvI
MPMSLADVVIGGGRSVLGKTLNNPFILAFAIMLVTFIIIIFMLWDKCKMYDFVKPFIISYIFTIIALFCYRDIVKSEMEKEADLQQMQTMHEMIMNSDDIVRPPM